MDAGCTFWIHNKKDKTNMNNNFYIEELTKKVESLEKRLEVLEKLLSGDCR